MLSNVVVGTKFHFDAAKEQLLDLVWVGARFVVHQLLAPRVLESREAVRHFWWQHLAQAISHHVMIGARHHVCR